jgi:nucleotide-binding universal stress UspA family protein
MDRRPRDCVSRRQRQWDVTGTSACRADCRGSATSAPAIRPAMGDAIRRCTRNGEYVVGRTFNERRHAWPWIAARSSLGSTDLTGPTQSCAGPSTMPARGRHRFRSSTLRLAYGSTAMYGDLPIPDSNAARASSEELVAGAVRRAAAAAPDLETSATGMDGDAVSLLLGLASAASTIVLASRRLGAVGSVVLGSVSVAVSAQASCPVVVVRGPWAMPRIPEVQFAEAFVEVAAGELGEPEVDARVGGEHDGAEQTRSGSGRRGRRCRRRGSRSRGWRAGRQSDLRTGRSP